MDDDVSDYAWQAHQDELDGVSSSSHHSGDRQRMYEGRSDVLAAARKMHEHESQEKGSSGGGGHLSTAGGSTRCGGTCAALTKRKEKKGLATKINFGRAVVKRSCEALGTAGQKVLRLFRRPLLHQIRISSSRDARPLHRGGGLRPRLQPGQSPSLRSIHVRVLPGPRAGAAHRSVSRRGGPGPDRPLN